MLGVARVQIKLTQLQELLLAAVHAFLVKAGAELVERRRLSGDEARLHQRGLRFDVRVRQREAFADAA